MRSEDSFQDWRVRYTLARLALRLEVYGLHALNSSINRIMGDRDIFGSYFFTDNESWSCKPYIYFTYALKCPTEKRSLRYAPNKQSSNTLLLASDRYFCRYATLGRKSHFHQGRNFTSTKGLAVQLESVGAG